MSKSELMGKTDDLAEKLKKVKEEMAGSHSQEKEESPKNSAKPNISPKLFVTGRTNRKKQKYIAKNIIIPVWMNEELKTYCRGVDISVLNYLISVGLKHVKESSSNINVDISEE
jgi:hypothetical protein